MVFLFGFIRATKATKDLKEFRDLKGIKDFKGLKGLKDFKDFKDFKDLRNYYFITNLSEPAALKLMSRPLTLCVKAPKLMKSTPA